jgi:hypothetical protein
MSLLKGERGAAVELLLQCHPVAREVPGQSLEKAISGRTVFGAQHVVSLIRRCLREIFQRLIPRNM